MIFFHLSEIHHRKERVPCGLVTRNGFSPVGYFTLDNFLGISCYFAGKQGTSQCPFVQKLKGHCVVGFQMFARYLPINICFFSFLYFFSLFRFSFPFHFSAPFSALFPFSVSFLFLVPFPFSVPFYFLGSVSFLDPFSFLCFFSFLCSFSILFPLYFFLFFFDFFGLNTFPL